MIHSDPGRRKSALIPAKTHSVGAWRFGALGEGMPQDFNLGLLADPARKQWTLFRVLAAATLLTAVVVAGGPARAGDDGSEAQASNWSKFMRTLGLKKPPDASGAAAGINYSERPPLVVPPTRDLPPPVADAGVPADWPKNSPNPVKRHSDKPQIIPDTAVQTPNPPYQKKPWYNPAGWFDKTEYATFTGEPVRQSLIDPPTGYRVPSADQPYGISSDKKKSKQPTGQDLHYGQVGGTQPGK
jgi:hypothetical protein